MFGGNLKYIISGSAPISGDVMNFLRVALCVRIGEGYG